MSKIEVAQHSFLCKKTNVEFTCADIANASYPTVDAILFGDYIHSIDKDVQQHIMVHAAKHLNENGIIVIRGHRQNSISANWINKFAQDNSMLVSFHSDDNKKSVTLYTLTAIKVKNEKI